MLFESNLEAIYFRRIVYRSFANNYESNHLWQIQSVALTKVCLFIKNSIFVVFTLIPIHYIYILLQTYASLTIRRLPNILSSPILIILIKFTKIDNSTTEIHSFFVPLPRRRRSNCQASASRSMIIILVNSSINARNYGRRREGREGGRDRWVKCS